MDQRRKDSLKAYREVPICHFVHFLLNEIQKLRSHEQSSDNLKQRGHI